MKHNFRIIIGMLLFAIPLCLSAQVKPVKPQQKPKQANIEEVEKEKLEKERAEIERVEKEKTEKKKESKGGLEIPKISGFVQGMYQADLNAEGKLDNNTFRMRRVRLSVDGTLFQGLTYKIQGDFTRKPMLVDAYIKYKACNEFAIQIGQFKTPFSIESPINPVNLEIFDYGEIIQGLVGYSDVCGVGSLGRDLGIMASGSLFPIKGEEGIKYHVVDYDLGIFNGNGANEKDNNNRKDIVGRLDIHPGLKALTISGSYYYGLYKNSTVEEEIKTIENGTFDWEDNTKVNKYNHGTRNRWAVGAQYNDGKIVVRGEYINGMTDYMHIEKDPLNMIEMTAQSNGYYAVAGYNFEFGKEGKTQKLMPVLRYEHFTKDASIEKGGTNWYTIGINYWPLKSVNFKLDYSLVQKEVGSNSHRIVALLSYKF